MRFPRDDRSQAIQIGAVLLFGILVVFLALYQGFVVPNQNEEIEFDHNQQLQSELTDMRSSVISMPGRTTTRSVSVGLGVRYPSRALFVNPGPASGTLRTVGTADRGVNLTIENATAEGEVGDFWNGTAHSYNTGGIEYRPGYNLFATAPRTAYEHSVLYNHFGDETTLSVTDQAMVSGDRITLVALNGSMSESRVGEAAVDFEPVSTDAQIVEISNESGVTLSMPTRLNESEWRDVFDEEMEDNGGNVTGVNTTDAGSPEGFSMLEVSLKPGTYDLQLAKVGVGTGVSETEEAYLTDVSGNGTSVREGGTRTLELEVRDEFNNPVSGVPVDGFATDGSFRASGEREITAETDGNGRVAVEYDPNSVEVGQSRTDEIEFTVDSGYAPNGTTHDVDTPENVTMAVTVDSASDSGSGNGETGAFDVAWQDPTSPPGTEPGCDADDCTLNYTEAQELELTAGTDPTAEGAPVNFAVNDTAVGEIKSGQSTDETGEGGDEEGEATTTFVPNDNGTVKVYAWGGGGGDAINVTVENFGVVNGSVLVIDDVRGLEDGGAETEYQPEVQISEVSGEATDGLDINLEVVGESEGEVFNGGPEDFEGEIGPDGTVNVTFDIGSLDADEYDYTVTVNADNADETESTGSFTVTEDAFFEVDIDEGESTLDVQEGETVEVVTDVFNSGDSTATQEIMLDIPGVGEVDSQDVTVEGEETEPVTLEWETGAGDAGDYQATVSSDDDDDSVAVSVASGSAEFEEVVVEYSDISGPANELEFRYETTDDGNVARLQFEAEDLDSGGEYSRALETPDSPTTLEVDNRVGGNDIAITATLEDEVGNQDVCTGTMESASDGDTVTLNCNDVGPTAGSLSSPPTTDTRTERRWNRATPAMRGAAIRGDGAPGPV